MCIRDRFQDENFFRSFRNSILLIVLVTVFTITLALLFASLLTREKLRGQNFFRVIFYIPNILSVVVISAIFSAIYDSNRGLLNALLSLFRGDADPIYWLGDQKIIIYSLVIAMVWQAIGYYMVMYMASMSSIPESLYESANLEGASKTRQFFSITLPLIWTNIRTTLTFFIISNINISFLLVKAMTGGGPDGSSEVFLSYMYKQAYTNSTYGYGMAAVSYTHLDVYKRQVRVFAEDLVHGRAVGDVGLDETEVLAGDLFYAGQGLGAGIVEIVHHDDVVPRIEQFNAGVAADITGAAADQDCHKNQLLFKYSVNRGDTLLVGFIVRGRGHLLNRFFDTIFAQLCYKGRNTQRMDDWINITARRPVFCRTGP